MAEKNTETLNRLEHIVYDLGVKRDVRKLFKEDQEKLWKIYRLQEEEIRIVKEFDVLKMVDIGVNSMAMMGFWITCEPNRNLGEYIKKLNGK